MGAAVAGRQRRAVPAQLQASWKLVFYQMMRGLHFGLAAWTAGCLLLAGCATSSNRRENAEVSPAQEEKIAAAHAHYAQGMIYEMNEEPDKALEEFSRAALADPSNEALVLEVAGQYMHGTPTPTAELSDDTAETNNPASPLAQAKAQTDRVTKAVELLRKAADEPGASAQVFALLGEGYSRLGKFAQATAATRQAIKLDPKALSGYRDLFIISLQKNKPEEALKALDDAAKIQSPGADYLADLAALYSGLQVEIPWMRTVAISNGLATLKRAEAADSSTPRVEVKLADTYDNLGDTTNAIRIYEKLLTQYSDLPSLRDSIHGKLAEIYLRTGNARKAGQELQAILADNPDNPQTYYFLGTVALEGQQWEQAATYFQRAIQFNDEFEQAYYDLATAQTASDQTNQALTTLGRAAAKFSTNFLNEFYTARVYVKAKDFTNAVTHFEAAETLAQGGASSNRLNSFFYFEAGAANERKGDFDQAVHYFEKSLKLSPDMPEALNYYGYMLADKGIKLDRARNMIEKAVKLDPQNAAYIDSLGWVLFKQGKPEDGLAQIQKAIELSNKDPDPTLYEHLGDIYAALKQPDKAREAWKKSVSLEPNAEVQKKLDQFSPH